MPGSVTSRGVVWDAPEARCERKITRFFGGPSSQLTKEIDLYQKKYSRSRYLAANFINREIRINRIAFS